MKKTPSLFRRDYDGNRQILNEVVPGSEWVLAGEGVATLKLDGTSCMIRDEQLYRRFDRKLSKQANRRKKNGHVGPWELQDFKPAPEGFEPCCAPDVNTGHWPGWVPVGEGPQDQYHVQAFSILQDMNLVANGTYELVGPAVQSNPYGLDRHELWRHGAVEVPLEQPLTFENLRTYLEEHHIEGIVWHHPDGRMVKIKRRDFGFAWPQEEQP